MATPVSIDASSKVQCNIGAGCCIYGEWHHGHTLFPKGQAIEMTFFLGKYTSLNILKGMVATNTVKISWGKLRRIQPDPQSLNHCNGE